MGEQTKRVYAFRVLVMYEGDARKPAAEQVQRYLEDSISMGALRVGAPLKVQVSRRGGTVVVLGQNDVVFSVARVAAPCRSRA